MAGPEATIVRKGARMIGSKLLKLAGKKAASRILGKLATSSRAWAKAAKHIALHFKPAVEKASHSVFEPQFRTVESVSKLVTRALGNLGRSPVLSTQEGRPVMILEKEFAEVIGKNADGTVCRILRIIVDYTGKPITAFPVDKFYSAAVLPAAFAVGTPDEIPTVAPVEACYVEEAQEFSDRVEKESDRITNRRGGKMSGVVQIIDFIVGTSSTAPDPNEMSLITIGELEARGHAAVVKIEGKLGYPLDDETKTNIREDVRQLWGKGREPAELIEQNPSQLDAAANEATG